MLAKMANQSQNDMFKINLQLFAEGDPVEPVSADPAPADPMTSDPAPAEPPTEPEPMFKLKYNHEEKEIPYSQAVELAQKGMNYDKGVERAKQEARDSYIADQGYEWNGKAITTEDEYKQAMEEQQIEQMIQARGYDPDEIAKVVSSHPDVKKAREFISSQEQKSQTDKMYQEFLDNYPDIKGEDIPPEVWREVQQGRNLTDAYVRHENKTLREQLNGVQTKEQAAAANQANAQTSTGSAKGQGAPESGFISKDVFEANKNNQSWMSKNYDNLRKSMGKWQ